MKAKEIIDLVDFLSNSGLEEVSIETEAFKIAIKRSNQVSVMQTAPAAPSLPIPAPVATPLTPPPTAPSLTDDSSRYVAIKAPMIGTFYKAANPESAPFVKVGDKIKTGDAVCIIEAMKLFNEIESEVTGTVVKIVAEDAQPVEYDQPLFLVDPS